MSRSSAVSVVSFGLMRNWDTGRRASTKGLPISRGPLRSVLVIDIQAMLAIFSAASASFGATMASSAGAIRAFGLIGNWGTAMGTGWTGLPVSRGPLRSVLVIDIQAMLAIFRAASASFGATMASFAGAISAISVTGVT